MDYLQDRLKDSLLLDNLQGHWDRLKDSLLLDYLQDRLKESLLMEYLQDRLKDSLLLDQVLHLLSFLLLGLDQLLCGKI